MSRATPSSRAIRLIPLRFWKCSNRIRAIVSTPVIPHPSKTRKGHPNPQVRGLIFDAKNHPQGDNIAGDLTESTFAYFNATQRYLEQHGKPVAFYTDKHAVFRVNKPSGLHGDGMTQFGRALKALSIEIICANSSQAKGRVERANKTLQDRLVKELRLAGVSTMEDGNAFLPAFMADYNARFAKAPFNDKDLHRPMTPRDRLDEAFTWRAERTLSQSLTLQYDNILFMIEPSEFAQRAIGQRVEVVDFPDGRLEVRYKGRSMPYRTFDRVRRVTETAVLENKRLGGLLALIRQDQQTQPPGERTRKGPKRRDQTGHMFSVG